MKNKVDTCLCGTAVASMVDDGFLKTQIRRKNLPFGDLRDEAEGRARAKTQG